MATADKLLERMFSWIQQREHCAHELRTQAQELESLRRKCNASECVGSSVSVVGAACLIGAGVATFFTGGAAAPLLGVAGAAYSGVGAAISVVTKLTEHFSSSDTIKKAQKIEEKSNEIGEEIQELFRKLKAERKRVSPSSNPDDLDRHVMTEILSAVARRSGLRMQINRGMMEMLFFDTGPRSMAFNQIFLKPGAAAGLGGILTFFAFQASGKEFKPFLDKGAEQLVKQITTTGIKTALKGGAMVVGGAVGLAFALPDAIDCWTDQIKNNHVTEASQSLRDTADTILKIGETLTKQFNEIRETLQQLAEVKRCIENNNRSSDEKQTMIDFTIKMCEDETVRQWLRETAGTQAFFHLVSMFNYLKNELERKLGSREEEINIIFVAHGEIEASFIPASALLPLPTIKDVVLYSPWNCFIDAGAAYGIATGSIHPLHRTFFCTSANTCPVPEMYHWPSHLPVRWNTMRAAGGQLIPNICVSPVYSEEGVWKDYLLLEGFYGQPGGNRVVIPFLLPEDTCSWLRVPFFVVTLAISLVLWFSPFKATVHLAACLGKAYAGETLYEQYLKEQYSCTIDNTGMRPSGDMVINNTNLYRALRAVFG